MPISWSLAPRISSAFAFADSTGTALAGMPIPLASAASTEYARLHLSSVSSDGCASVVAGETDCASLPLPLCCHAAMPAFHRLQEAGQLGRLN